MLDNLLNPKQYDQNAQTMSSTFFANVYTYMFIALGLSGTIAYMVGSDLQTFAYYFVTAEGKISALFWVVALLPIGVGLLIQMAYRRISMSVLIILFAVYSILMGLSLSSVFIVYSIGSIASTFLVTAGAFGAMAILGYTTKTDLTKFGSLLYMAFIGIFFASIAQIFFHNEMFDTIIAVVGVFVFTGLTAYEMQNLKYIAQDPELSGLDKSKLSLIGGLRLYILFINLFLSLLRLMGSRD
jgi:FtsH-binding integral membrane protein